jgi:hypothetical protein
MSYKCLLDPMWLLYGFPLVQGMGKRFFIGPRAGVLNDQIAFAIQIIFVCSWISVKNYSNWLVFIVIGYVFLYLISIWETSQFWYCERRLSIVLCLCFDNCFQMEIWEQCVNSLGMFLDVSFSESTSICNFYSTF